MTTLQELIYYCNEPEPIGALMITGEWGCGKTFLLENILKNELIKSHVILRVSLFGITSVALIDESVHNAWMNAYLEDKGWSEKSNTLSKLKDKLSRLPLSDDLKNIISFNPATIMNIEKELNEKKVVLVFDDLERSKLDTIDILGCINNYIENQKIYTIVVANEDKILNKKDDELKNNSQKIAYDEIKEKIIERTIRYKPDYTRIVHEVIEKQKYLSKPYHDFLVKFEKNISEIFAIESTNQLHNIRSLKCALQGFYRVYNALVNQNFIDNLENRLYSFIAYMFAYKMGVAKEEKYGTIITDGEVQKLYPIFNNRYMLETAKNWILKGEWNDEFLKAEIQKIKDCEKAIEPKDIVRMNYIMDIDDNVLQKGFSEVVEMAYNGELSLNEYVFFIQNCCLARKYNLILPCYIEWHKVKIGVNHCINKLIDENAEDSHVKEYIDETSKNLYSKEEWEIYEFIKNFWDNNILIFEENRKLYLLSIKNDSIQAFMQNKIVNVFDEEMAEVTAEAFFENPNYKKHQFIGFFKYMWRNIKYMKYIKVEDTIKGFEKLLLLLEKKEEKLKKENMMIAIKHTDNFIETIENLIKEVE